MDNVILKTRGLTKKYKNKYVLDDINITIKKGQIYGLIGLNGAGKTTLIRLITGLALKNSGSIELFGKSEEKEIEKARRNIGAIIESPSLYLGKTAYQNLEISRIQKGIPGKECIEKALKRVGLNDVKNKKVKNFSMGMKQRLGIAMAILSEPEFLILDEPINGLDPIGIIEVRELLKKLNEEYKTTILISSHILGELYQVANSYAIIQKGRLIEQITSKELDSRCKKHLYIKVDNAAKASVVINEKLSTSNFEVLPKNIIKLYEYLDNTGKVSNTLFKEGILVEEITPKGDDLEIYFSKVIGGCKND